MCLCCNYGCQLNELRLPWLPPVNYHVASFMCTCAYVIYILWSLIVHCGKINLPLLFLLLCGKRRTVTPNKWIRFLYNLYALFLMSLQWRHNECDGFSNHRRLECLLNRLSGGDQGKHGSSASLAFVRGSHRGLVKSPQKGPVTRKMFPFDDVIISAQLELLHMPQRGNQRRNVTSRGFS